MLEKEGKGLCGGGGTKWLDAARDLPCPQGLGPEELFYQAHGLSPVPCLPAGATEHGAAGPGGVLRSRPKGV